MLLGQRFPGFGIHDELELLVAAGMSPLAALQAATRNAAQFIGQLDRRGTIEVGKIPDLVLLARNSSGRIGRQTLQALGVKPIAGASSSAGERAESRPLWQMNENWPRPESAGSNRVWIFLLIKYLFYR